MSGPDEQKDKLQDVTASPAAPEAAADLQNSLERAHRAGLDSAAIALGLRALEQEDQMRTPGAGSFAERVGGSRVPPESLSFVERERQRRAAAEAAKGQDGGLGR